MIRPDSVTTCVAVGAGILLAGGLIGAGGFLFSHFNVMFGGIVTAAAGVAIIMGAAFYHLLKEELAKNEKENFTRDYGVRLSSNVEKPKMKGLLVAPGIV